MGAVAYNYDYLIHYLAPKTTLLVILIWVYT